MADSQVLEANWELTDSFPSALFKKKVQRKTLWNQQSKALIICTARNDENDKEKGPCAHIRNLHSNKVILCEQLCPHEPLKLSQDIVSLFVFLFSFLQSTQNPSIFCRKIKIYIERSNRTFLYIPLYTPHITSFRYEHILF